MSEMNQSTPGDAIQALQGKHFQVTLATMRGSSGYDWTVKTLPAGIQLGETWFENTPGQARGRSDKVFLFFAIGDPEGPVDIVFQSLSWSDPRQTGEEVSIKVMVIPYDSEALAGFVKYSDNNAVFEGGVLAPPYGYFAPEESCGVPVLKYGYPGCVDSDLFCNDAVVKYGYPVVKYGYPGCSTDNLCAGEPFVKYGYPVVKYGYPGCSTDNVCAGGPVVKYGYPVVKYGYPGCSTDPCCEVAYVKYGYPGCTDDDCYCNPAILKYGYPVLKYGYPGCC